MGCGTYNLASSLHRNKCAKAHVKRSGTDSEDELTRTLMTASRKTRDERHIESDAELLLKASSAMYVCLPQIVLAICSMSHENKPARGFSPQMRV